MTHHQEKVRRALEEIAASSGGTLRPEDVVKAAKAPEHPLHPAFEWNDSVAAERHRLDQARALIRSVKIEIRTDKQTVKSVYYVRDPALPPSEEGYSTILTVRSDKDRSIAVLRQEFDRVLGILQRARDMAIVLGFEMEFDEAVGSVRKAADAVPNLKAV